MRNESRRHVRAVLSLALVSILPACGKTHDAPLPPSPPGVVNSRWVWMGGTSNCNVMGSYGTQGTADPSNYPGGRVYAASWNDSSGNRMVFGGTTIISWGPIGYLNDTWKFDGSNWTWVSGPNTTYIGGNWGTKGVAAASNIPSARGGSSFTTDPAGNLWLFGGEGILSDGNTSGNKGWLSDLWKFDGSFWTWISGPIQLDQGSTFGTKGVPAGANAPGARANGAAWVDNAGAFWLFGGGTAAQSSNDLWTFDGTNWTWISGANTPGSAGTYGTKGVASPSNAPGARWAPAYWTDAAGNFWLFGGKGYDSAGSQGDLGDLWKFDGTNWTWISGSSSVYPPLVSGTRGVTDPGNSPGGRWAAAGWPDGLGNFWIFGGNYASDLWKFDGVNWTWVGGPSAADQHGTYGTVATPGPSNEMGGRHGSNAWVDGPGKFWLFGGYGHDQAGTVGMMDDIWRFTPP